MSDRTGIQARVSAALADRYVIQRTIGSGGMATVYLAHDRRHDRQVAVKVLRPDLSAALGSERFLREIRITARLAHPHVLPLLDSGEADGLLYYVMPFVAGGSLRERLRKSPPPNLAEALHIARQVADALGHAHRHGIVHRDVKPENILLAEGHAVVADFGIARAVSTATDQLTRSGFPLGTPGYMSPEQAAGRLDPDARTDVFGLGCVVYELLVGGTPEMWPTEEAVRLGRFVDASPAHAERLDRLPGRVQQVLVRALALRPADRYAGPVDFADALAVAAGRSEGLRESEVRDVLRRAAELQADQPTEDPALSIGAVEQVAAEVGIPPTLVRRAALEVRPATAPDIPAPDHGSFPTGLDVRQRVFAVDRTSDREVAAETLGAMVVAIHETLGLVGHATVIGGSLTWSPAAQGATGRQILVTVASGGGRTRVRVEERLELTGFRRAVPGISAGLAALLGIGMGSALGPGILLPVALAAAGVAYLAVRGLVVTMANERAPRLTALADRLTALAGSPDAPAART